MNKYELTVLVDGKTTAAKKKKLQETLEKTISLLKGKVEKVEDSGVKDLSYKIKKSISGIYLFFQLDLSPDSAKSLLTKLRAEQEILRSLMIRVEK